MKAVILIIFMSPFYLNAETEKMKDTTKYKKLMQNYLAALFHKDKELLKSISSNDFYKRHEVQYFNKDIKQDGKFNPEGIDIVVYPAAYDKNLYRLNIKDKSQKQFGDLWYIISEKKNKLKIERTEMDEE